MTEASRCKESDDDSETLVSLPPFLPFLPVRSNEQREEMTGENDDKAFNVSVRGLRGGNNTSRGD